MQKNLHLLTSNPSTAHLVANAETHTEEGNDVSESSNDGLPDDSPRQPLEAENPAQAEQPNLIGFLAGIQETFLQGLKDMLPMAAQIRAAALHTAGLVLGPGATAMDRIDVARFLLALDEDN